MSNQAVVSGSGTECPVCGGTGQELYWDNVDGYDKPLVFARKCMRCNSARWLHDNTNAPPQFRDADLNKFCFDIYSRNMAKLEKLVMNFFNKFREWEKFGKGLYIWSKTPGSGKTFLSCALCKSIMMRYNLRLRFITAPDYLAAVGESYKRERGMYDESRIYRECELLIFDDLGSQKSGDWQNQEVFRLVNERLNAGKITVYTANMPPEELNVGERTINRIIGTSIVVQMPEESIRKKKAEEEQAKFLRMINVDA